MSSEAARTNHDQYLFPGVALAFCVGVFAFVWRWVDTSLLYHGDMVTLTPQWWIVFPPFFLGWDFFWEQVRQPGGLVSYAANLLMQYYCYPSAGALIVAALAGVLIWGAHALGAAIEVAARRVWAFVPALALLGTVTSYLLLLDAFLSVACALACLAAFARGLASARGARRAVWVFVLLSPPLCWALGGAYLLCALGYSLVVWRKRQRPLAAMTLLSFAVVVFCGALYLQRIRQPDEGFHLSVAGFAGDAYEAAWPTLAGLPVIAAMLAWDRVACHRSRKTPAARAQQDRARGAVVGIAVLVGTSVLVSFGLMDQESRTLLRANYFARTNQWTELLAEIRSHPPTAYAPGLLYDINRALFETGQLGDRMFEFPQDPRFLLQIGTDAVPYRGCAALLLRLGCVNEAEHTAFEALEVRGPRPYLLRDLAVIHIVKDRPEAARVFLRRLACDLIQGRWARECLERLAKDPRLEGDSEVTEIRRRMLQEDRIVLSSLDLLRALVDENPRNRAAFEYLTAHYLLTCQLEEVVKQIPKLRDAGLTHLPASYGEALLLHCELTGDQPDVGGWTVTPEAIDLFRKFLAVTRDSPRDPNALNEVLAGTYYPYFATHHTSTHEAAKP